MKLITSILSVILLAGVIFIFTGSTAGEKEAAKCPYMEKYRQEQSIKQDVCPYKPQKEKLKECPYSNGKSLY